MSHVLDSMSLTSDSFPAGGTMPLRFAGKGVGDNFSPALRWSSPPAGTQELVLVMQDPDVPLRHPWVHLIAYGISASTAFIGEGELAQRNTQFRFGRNTFAGGGYAGPRALPGHGPHHYVFQMFALNRTLGFAKPPSLKELLHAMDGMVLARGRLDGVFEQK
jgi:Raf kinase inhibitor-like YbhB/YbcL family protein